MHWLILMETFAKVWDNMDTFGLYREDIQLITLEWAKSNVSDKQNIFLKHVNNCPASYDASTNDSHTTQLLPLFSPPYRNDFSTLIMSIKAGECLLSQGL